MCASVFVIANKKFAVRALPVVYHLGRRLMGTQEISGIVKLSGHVGKSLFDGLLFASFPFVCSPAEEVCIFNHEELFASRSPLPEDIMLLGFSPLAGVQERLSFDWSRPESRLSADQEVRNYCPNKFLFFAKIAKWFKWRGRLIKWHTVKDPLYRITADLLKGDQQGMLPPELFFKLWIFVQVLFSLLFGSLSH